MKSRALVITVVAAGVLAATGFGAYRIGIDHGMQTGNTTAVNTVKDNQAVDPATDKKILYWHDPMVPAQKFDKPGKSPFMDMPLVPV